MSQRRQEHILFVLLAAATFILTGCPPPPLKPPTRICPGRQSLSQSLDSLKSSSESIISLKATGRCYARFYVEDKKYKERPPVRLWLNPPAKVCLHGDLLFNPRGIMLGSNEHEFWLRMKPKEISTYYWGLWSEQDSLHSLLVNPKIILEAFGIVGVGGSEDWSLSNEGPFDVLTQRNSRGGIIKKVYIFSCDYQVFKIEYFNEDEQVIAVAKLYKYKEVSKGCFVPRVINITTHGHEDGKDSFDIRLKSVTPYEFDEKKQRIYFEPPSSKGIEHIYRIIDSKVIEQPH